jgi:ABC-2 type transport system permease protein
MLPNMLLSGLIFPIASLPGWLRPVTYLVPARWFILVSRGIMLKGVGLEYLWRELAVLGVMLGVLLLAAVKSFRARMA